MKLRRRIDRVEEAKRILLANRVDGFTIGYEAGFKAGMRHAENHCFALPDVEPSAEDLKRQAAADRRTEEQRAKVLAARSTRPDAEAERLRGALLDDEPPEPGTPLDIDGIDP
jgi:hypothetical protein